VFMVNHVFAFSRRSDRIVQMVSFLAKLSQPVHSGIQVHDFDPVYGLLVLNVSHEQTNKQASTSLGESSSTIGVRYPNPLWSI